MNLDEMFVFTLLTLGLVGIFSPILGAGLWVLGILVMALS